MCTGTGEKPGVPGSTCAQILGLRRAFTLIELLVVISIISLLMAILVPALGAAKRQALSVLGVGDQHQIVGSVLCYALDNDDLYPESVGTTGRANSWYWHDPTTLTALWKRAPHLHRSMSAYLRSYIPDATMMTCRNAPREHEYLQEAWDAGDAWVHPDIPGQLGGSLVGTYCFYWNYDGFLRADGRQVMGPSGTAGGPGQIELLVSCYLGYDRWPSKDVYSSCEKFKGAEITEMWGTSASWSAASPDVGLESLDIKLHAGYTDGHVEAYSASEAVPMEIMDRTTGEPYDPMTRPGIFYLPTEALH